MEILLKLICADITWLGYTLANSTQLYHYQTKEQEKGFKFKEIYFSYNYYVTFTKSSPSFNPFINL